MWEEVSAASNSKSYATRRAMRFALVRGAPCGAAARALTAGCEIA
jgi:hypothetical protein